MSYLMDVLLADSQRLEARREPHGQAASRADKIIAEGDSRRVSYRRLDPTAAPAMVFGAQIGYLHEQVRVLDAELAAFTTKRDPALQYQSVLLNEVHAAVTVGYTYSPGVPARVTSALDYERTGDPGSPAEPEDLTIEQVWLNGVDIAPIISDEVHEAITDKVLRLVHAGPVQP